MNRHQKVDKDLAQWLPALNQCRYVNRIVQVKRKYNLSMDQAEANTARRVLAACSSTQMQFTDPGSAPLPPADTPTPSSEQACPRNCTEGPRHGHEQYGKRPCLLPTEIRSGPGWYRLRAVNSTYVSYGAKGRPSASNEHFK